jgi:hypothetical protein
MVGKARDDVSQPPQLQPVRSAAIGDVPPQVFVDDGRGAVKDGAGGPVAERRVFTIGEHRCGRPSGAIVAGRPTA